MVATTTTGSAQSEPAGCPWQMASLWSFRGLCHRAADVGRMLAHRHTSTKIPGSPRQAGWRWDGSGGTCCDFSFSLYEIKHLCALGASANSSSEGLLKRGLRPGCCHVVATGLRRQLWVGWNEGWVQPGAGQWVWRGEAF